MSAFLILIPVVPSLFLYPEYLLYSDIWSAYVIKIPWVDIFWDAYIIPVPWVPTSLWYQDCLPYSDILKRYHNKAGKCAYLIMISGVPRLLIYPELIDIYSACFIMTSWVPMLLIYTECLTYYDICWKMANCAFLINISVVPTLLWHGECLPYYNLPIFVLEEAIKEKYQMIIKEE